MRFLRGTVLGGVVAVFLSSQAMAGTLPPFSMSLTDGTITKNWNSGGTANADGTFTYSGNQTTADWKASWSINADSDPAVNGVFSITNSTAVTNTYIATFLFPLSTPITPSSKTGGSVQGGVTDNNGDGATLSTAGANPFYMSLTDGSNFQALLNSPQNLTVGPFLSGVDGPAAFGTPIPSFPGPAILSDIGIRLEFKLTPGDSASFTSVFVAQPVPEPATSVMLAAGAIGLVVFAWRARRGK